MVVLLQGGGALVNRWVDYSLPMVFESIDISVNEMCIRSQVHFTGASYVGCLSKLNIVIKTIPQILPPRLLVWMLTQFFQDFTAFLSHSLLATLSLLDQNQLARLLSCPETQWIWFIMLNVMGCPQCLLHTINCFVVYGVIWDNQVLSPLSIWLKSPGLPLSI